MTTPDYEKSKTEADNEQSTTAADRDDAGPLCLLRHNGQLSTNKLVRPSGRDDLAEMAGSCP